MFTVGTGPYPSHRAPSDQCLYAYSYRPGICPEPCPWAPVPTDQQSLAAHVRSHSITKYCSGAPQVKSEGKREREKETVLWPAHCWSRTNF